ncbi:MAG: hypothetical protein DRQ62_15750, partial [Gammaproteobacteria bacterium]
MFSLGGDMRKFLKLFLVASVLTFSSATFAVVDRQQQVDRVNERRNAKLDQLASKFSGAKLAAMQAKVNAQADKL